MTDCPTGIDNPPKEIDNKLIVLKGIRSLSNSLLNQEPQVNRDGKLLYYFAGSFGMNLFFQSQRIENLDPMITDEIKVTSQTDIPLEQLPFLQSGMRSIGDIDIIQTKAYQQLPRNQTLYSTQLNFPIAQEMRPALKNGSTYIDKPSTEGKYRRVVRVDSDGKDAYILDPRLMLVYKLANIASSKQESRNKAIQDFKGWYDRVKLVFGHDSIVQVAHDYFTGVTPGEAFPDSVFETIPEAKAIMAQAIEIDPNKHFVRETTWPREYTLSLLGVLSHYKKELTKIAVMDFLNKNPNAPKSILHILTTVDENSLQPQIDLMSIICRRQNAQDIFNVFRLIFFEDRFRDPSLRNVIIQKILSYSSSSNDEEFYKYCSHLLNYTFSSLCEPEEQEKRIAAFLNPGNWPCLESLSRQPNYITTVCPAYSLVNALKLADCEISDGEVEQLEEKIIKSAKPLSTELQNAFVARHGFRMRSLLPFSSDDINDFTSAINRISHELDNGQILITISSHLSKRDIRIVPTLNWSDPKLALQHEVVLTKKKQTIFIVDPYNPTNPEVFDMEDSQSRNKLVKWLLSTYSQLYFDENNLPTDKTKVLERAHSLLVSKNTHPLGIGLTFAKPIKIEK